MTGKWNEITPEKLAEEYADLSCKQLADKYGVKDESVRVKLVKFGIDRRPANTRRTFNPDKSELESLYQKHSMAEIAKIYGCGETVVFKRLKEHGITLKSFEKGGHRLKPGRVFSDEHLVNLRAAAELRRKTINGELNPNWKGGVTYKHISLRSSVEYKNWRKLALDRAGNKCEECGIEKYKVCGCCGTKTVLHVHHIKSFAKYPELRFEPSNSEVLCPKCHNSRHK